ncbi:MAG: alpha/beta hydrolase [Terracidiphilus sp.]|jgi:pimeloyl-ACP methyl ester carboxylesterase
MRGLRLIAIVGFVQAGLALPSILSSETLPPPKTVIFAPARFTVMDLGTAGKPDVLMIPGLSTSRAVWDAESMLLAANYRLHLVQVNGFAGTEAGANASGQILVPVVEELHTYIVANKMHPIVIGHSLGGLLTLMLADKHPGDVKKIVIVDTLPFTSVLIDPAATAEKMMPQAEAIKQQMMAMPADQYAAMQPTMAARMVTSPEAQKMIAASFAASDRGVAVEAMEEDLETDLRADVASIKTPALILYAYDPAAQQPDAATYEATVRAAYKSMPNAILTRIDDSRHFIMYDQPAKFDAALEDFLK